MRKRSKYERNIYKYQLEFKNRNCNTKMTYEYGK